MLGSVVVASASGRREQEAIIGFACLCQSEVCTQGPIGNVQGTVQSRGPLCHYLGLS